MEAHLRQMTLACIPYYVVQRGSYASGTVLLKINFLNGACRVLNQIRGIDGQLGWMKALKEEHVAESDADGYIRRAIGRDPDLWVIEIEDRSGKNPFEGKQIL